MCTAVDDERPYFAFEGEVSAVPATPLECRGCGAVLEPLRRTGGYCKPCIRARSQPAEGPPDELRGHMTVVRTLYRQRVGHRERFVEARCDCGRRRVLKWSTWVHKRPRQCNTCRMRGIDRRGFEAERMR